MIAHVNGVDINYEVHGEGTPLVLAHGYTATLRMWDQQIATFASKYRTVIYDSRGHGGSSAPADLGAYDMERDFVADQLALMDHLGIGEAYVGGLSMGGMIAQAFALAHPERVRALLLLDTGPGMGGFRDPAMAERMTQMRGVMQTVARSAGMAGIVQAMRNNPAAFRPSGDGPLPPGVIAHGQNMLKMSVDGFLGAGGSLGSWRGSLDRLATIAVPTLILVGEQDQLLRASNVMHERIAGSRFVLLRNCGHGSSVWRPEAAAGAIMAFLADVDAGRPVVGSVVVE